MSENLMPLGPNVSVWVWCVNEACPACGREWHPATGLLLDEPGAMSVHMPGAFDCPECGHHGEWRKA